MATIPVMDQDSKNICYACTASQMVDSWRFSHGDKDVNHLTSPIAAAVFYASQRTDFEVEDIDGGWQSETVNSIIKNGSCDYKSIYNKFGQNGLNEYFGTLKKQFDDFQRLAIRQTPSPSKRKAMAEAVKCAIESANKRAPAPQIEEIIRALSQPKYLGYLEELFAPICQKRGKRLSGVPKAKVLWAMHLTPAARARKLQDQITDVLGSENPQPIGMDFCEDVLFDKKVVGIDHAGQLDWKTCSAQHAALIIGQRQTPSGRCEFLVRNSHGQSCNPYKDWDCDKQTGQIWVESEVLIRNIYGLSWLED